MGLSWLRSAKYSHPVSFLYSVDDPQAFLDLPDDAQIDRLLQSGAAQLEVKLRNHLATRLTGLGALEGVPEAILSPIWFNTMYREDKGHRFIMVDRPWARNDDGWGIAFNWDTFSPVSLPAGSTTSWPKRTFWAVSMFSCPTGAFPCIPIRR